jgi:hypothetical protein
MGISMRMREITEADGWYGGFSGVKMGDKAARAFKRRELEHELRDEGKPMTYVAYFKIPREFKWAANENKLAWDGDKQLWYKTWSEAKGRPTYTNNVQCLKWDNSKNAYVQPEEAAKALDFLKRKTAERGATVAPEAPVAAPTSAPAAKQDIKLTHLHYFNVDDVQAASAGLKKDKRGKWYLPQYNTSGGKFQSTLADLTAKFGTPKTVTLK